MSVPVGGQVKLQRLGLKAQPFGDVLNDDLGKIGLAGDGTEGCKIRAVEANGKIAAGLGLGNVSILRPSATGATPPGSFPTA